MNPIALLIAPVLALGSPLLAADLPPHVFTHYAGSDGGSGSEDGAGPDARFFSPVGIGIDASGNLYVADINNATIRKVAPDGATTTLAGLAGATGDDDGRGVSARFDGPGGTAVDSAGNVYVADLANHAIRKISPGGVVALFAGGGYASGVDGNGMKAKFKFPSDVAVDAADNVYVADSGTHTIRKITPSGDVTTLAGTFFVEGREDGTGASARFRTPSGIAVGPDGTVWVADERNDAIRAITPDGRVTTVAGAGGPGRADGTGSAASFYRPAGLTVGPDGNVFVADTSNNLIRKMTPAGVVTTIAGGSDFVNGGSADGVGRDARFASPIDIVADHSGNLYVADADNDAIRKVTADGVVSTFAGRPLALEQRDGSRASARFTEIRDMVADASGNVYLIDAHVIRRISAAGDVTTIAGSQPPPQTAPEYQDGTGTAARFKDPSGIAVDTAGNLYVTERSEDTLRKVTPQGVVTTFAGTRQSGRTDGPLLQAQFSSPADVAVDAAGAIWVVDDCTVRKIVDGVVTTVTGWVVAPARRCTDNVDGPYASAQLDTPDNLVIDSTGALYVTTTQTYGSTYVASTANTIRRIDPAGFVTTVAGDDSKGTGYHDGRGKAARFYNIGGLALDGAGGLWVTEPFVNAVRHVDPDGVVTTVGGYPGVQGTADGTALDARFNGPKAIVADGAAVLIAEAGRIRAARPALSDRATIDAAVGVTGAERRLDAATSQSSGFAWRVIRAPAASSSILSSRSVAAPTFVPDLDDLWGFRLTASAGASLSITETWFLGDEGTATAAGSSIALREAEASLTFPSVTAAGRTVIAALGTLPSADLPPSPIYAAYDVTTTARFTPPVRFCLALEGLRDAEQLARYAILHVEGSSFADRTVSRDATTMSVCAETQSLGRFLLLGPRPRQRPVVR